MVWDLNRLVTKIQNDQELHAENFVTKPEIVQYIDDAIEDAEQLIIDSFSDFFLTSVDASLTEGDKLVALPSDIYDLRIRGLYYDKNGFDQNATAGGRWYKIKKLPLERFAAVHSDDHYHYRLMNKDTGPELQIFPDFRETTTSNVKLFYIRQARRLVDDSDILEKGLKPQFILAHAKFSIMEKEGDPMADTMLERLNLQSEKLISAVSRLTDDNEDSLLEMDVEALDEAYGDSESGPW